MVVDLGGVEKLIPPIAQALGIEPATMLLFVGVLVTAANIAGRLIPDDAVGWLGTVRKVCKVIGLYAANRVTAGVTTTDVAKVVLGTGAIGITKQVTELAEQPGSLIPEVIEEGRELVEDPFGKAASIVRDRLDEEG